MDGVGAGGVGARALSPSIGAVGEGGDGGANEEGGDSPEVEIDLADG